MTEYLAALPLLTIPDGRTTALSKSITHQPFLDLVTDRTPYSSCVAQARRHQILPLMVASSEHTLLISGMPAAAQGLAVGHVDRLP